MFRKIVSNLPFSPTLINELGFYARRLKKEETTRRLGLILTALALLVQSFTVFSPPESANAASASDLIHGGIYTKSRLLEAWDNNTQGYRELLENAGITRDNLANTKEGEINTRTKGTDNGWLSWGRQSRGGVAYNETSMQVGKQTIYVRSLSALDTGNNTKGGGSYYPSFIGTNSDGKQFVIIKSCANVAMKERPSSNKDIKVCQLDTRKVITIREKQFNSSEHSGDLSDCEDKPIQVCDLASLQMTTIDEREFDARKYSKNPADCQPKPSPIANCSSLTYKRINRTDFELRASASVANGATIKSYTYVIKDKNGKEVLRKTNVSGATTDTLTSSLESGTYTAELTVDTSMGKKTANACQTDFKIEAIARCPLNQSLAINDPACQPCIGDASLWFKDENCIAKVMRNKEAKNLTSGTSATSVVAKASDRIEYILTVKNEGNNVAEFEMTDNISDILEYANLYDRGDGKLDEQTKVLSWGKVTLEPGAQQKRAYVIQLASKISPMSQGSSDPSSYDCKIINTFGNTIEVNVNCPTPKLIEQTIVTELPRTGPTANVIAGGIVASIVAFLYLRSRQLSEEVRLIRREVTAGTI